MSGILQTLLWGAGVIKDAYFNLVTLLLNTTSTNGAQNNTFLDSSSNNFTITRNGNTTQGTFSPFSQTGWSNFMSSDGTAAFSVAYNAGFAPGSGDFTVEGWVYFTKVDSNDQSIAGNINASTGDGDWGLFWRGGANRFEFSASSSGLLAGLQRSYNTTVPVVGQWYHVVGVKSGSTLSCYVNGVKGTDATLATVNNGSLTLYIGQGSPGTGRLYGYISNARIVKGTAVYSGSSFTVPTAPLTAITNTQLLTCQSNRFVDNSTNNFTITVAAGTPSIQAFSPFAPTVAYDTTTVGGSGYFDGSGDYLSVSSGITNAGTGDLCVEFFAYWTGGSFSDYKFAFDSRTSGGSFLDGVAIAANTSTGAWYVSWAGQEIVGTAKAGAYWNHVCLTRQSGVFRLFVDGVLQGTYTPSPAQNYTSTTNRIGWYYGATTSYQWSGYISGFRTTKSAVPTTYQTSSTTVGASIFTPPSAPLTTTSQGASGTSFLLNFTNAGIVDSTAKNVLETVGNAQVSTAQSKFGGSSMYFDGTGDYLPILYSPNLNINSGDFTIEAWVYPTASKTFNTIVSMWNASGSYSWILDINNGVAGFAWATSSTSVNMLESGSVSLNTWTHIAVTRSGNTFRLFVNGTQTTSTTSTDNSQTTNIYVGAYANGASGNYQGYIDDLRITKGYARYTANFTPPSAAFPVQ